MGTFASHGFQVWRRNERLEVTRIADIGDLDAWCNGELVLARDSARIAEVFR
jgi:hypothetical protein